MRSLSRRVIVVLSALLLLAATTVSAMSRSEAMSELRLKPTGGKKFTPKEVKAAYRKRSLETHPDKGGSVEAFLRVAEAYEELSSDIGGGGAGGKRKFSNDGGGSGGNNSEKMKAAEEMFFTMFDDLFEADTAGAVIDQVFDQIVGKHETLSYSTRMLKSFIKWIAPKFMNALESENSHITINGNKMSGPELKEWRAQRRGGRIDKESSDL